MTEKIYKNIDIVMLLIVMLLSFIIGFVSCIICFQIGAYIGYIKANPNIYSLITGSVAFILGIIADYYAMIFKLHTPNGEITNNLIEKANKPKELLDNDYNTFVGEIKISNVNIVTNEKKPLALQNLDEDIIEIKEE
jgi:vacuolar-type H+-ATPase subunit I/STV1